jgi:3',5'-cyclic AMP phosphodiesterase CpdA
VQIALVSDTHFQKNDAYTRENWDAARRWLAAEAPDIVVHLGDITANGMHDASALLHARELLAGAHADLLCLPGNHDVGDHAPAGGLHEDEPVDADRLAKYRRLFGPDHWSRGARGWQLVGINAQVLSTGLADEEQQFAWLAEVLAAHDGPLGVFLHKPLFRDRPEEDVIHTRYVPAAARRRLLAALQARDLRFVAAGHTHQMRQITARGVEHVWVPSTAFTLPDFVQERIGAKHVGIMTLELQPDSHRFTHVVPAGMKHRSLLEFAHVYPAIADLREMPR